MVLGKLHNTTPVLETISAVLAREVVRNLFSIRTGANFPRLSAEELQRVSVDLEELRTACSKLGRGNKAPGPDGIPSVALGNR